MTDLEALVVAAYVFADEYPVPARSGPRAKVSDAELVALAVCQAAMGISSDRQFLGLIGWRHGRAGFSVSAVAVAIQPAAAEPHRAPDRGATAACEAPRRRRCPPC